MKVDRISVDCNMSIPLRIEGIDFSPMIKPGVSLGAKLEPSDDVEQCVKLLRRQCKFLFLQHAIEMTSTMEGVSNDIEGYVKGYFETHPDFPVAKRRRPKRRDG